MSLVVDYYGDQVNMTHIASNMENVLTIPIYREPVSSFCKKIKN